MHEIGLDAQALTQESKDLKNALNRLKEDLEKECEQSGKEHSAKVGQLGNIVRYGIEEAEKRAEKIQQDCTHNTSVSNGIKYVLVEVGNRVQALENCLGIHTMTDKL